MGDGGQSGQGSLQIGKPSVSEQLIIFMPKSGFFFLSPCALSKLEFVILAHQVQAENELCAQGVQESHSTLSSSFRHCL